MSNSTPTKRNRATNPERDMLEAYLTVHRDSILDVVRVCDSADTALNAITSDVKILKVNGFAESTVKNALNKIMPEWKDAFPTKTAKQLQVLKEGRAKGVAAWSRNSNKTREAVESIEQRLTNIENMLGHVLNQLGVTPNE